jgi:hypothetical protein
MLVAVIILVVVGAAVAFGVQLGRGLARATGTAGV